MRKKDLIFHLLHVDMCAQCFSALFIVEWFNHIGSIPDICLNFSNINKEMSECVPNLRQQGVNPLYSPKTPSARNVCITHVH